MILVPAGGHGIIYDGPVDQDFIALGNRFWAEGKIISSVCHGPAGLVGMTAPDGTSIFKGKKVTLSVNGRSSFSCTCCSQIQGFLIEYTKKNRLIVCDCLLSRCVDFLTQRRKLLERLMWCHFF